MATSEMSVQDELPPFTAMPWKEFKKDPQSMYGLFHPAPKSKGRSYDSDSAIHGNDVRKVRVQSVEDLLHIKEDLLNKPILFRVKMVHLKTNNYVLFETKKYWTDKYAVLVNPKSSVIQGLLSKKLAMGVSLMQEGRKFCLKIDFGECLRQAYSDVIGVNRGETKSGKMKIYIHNCSTPGPFTDPLCIVYRKKNVTDFKQKFSNIPVTMMSKNTALVTESRLPRYAFCSV